MAMDNPRYLPANHVEAGKFPVGQLSVRTSDDREIGKLAGFVISENRIKSLVVEGKDSKVEVPMTAVQFDADSRALRLVEPGSEHLRTFSPASVPQVEPDDLWIPVFHTAA